MENHGATLGMLSGEGSGLTLNEERPVLLRQPTHSE